MTQSEIKLPQLSLVVLVGISGSGKSTFAARHFLPTEIISSDHCRALVSNDENDLSATPAAFEVLNFIAEKRLIAGKLTVIDATSLRAHDRKLLVALARKYHVLPVAIVLDLPESLCLERNRERTDRRLSRRVIKRQSEQLRRGKKSLKREGFRQVWKIRDPEKAENAIVSRVPLWNDKSHLSGPFDIIGDIHGCAEELKKLLEKLGYRICGHRETGPMSGPVWAHPKGRIAVFLGDLVDRGEGIVETLRLVYNMVETGHALCVPGNHEVRLTRKLSGQKMRIAHGLAESLAQIEALSHDAPSEFVALLKSFMGKLVSHYVLDGGNLVVAHAGIPEEMQGRGSGRVRDFCLFGETTGETDAFGLPVRHNWATKYRGNAFVVYGHTPVPKPQWLNRTVNVDTGCVFGGSLSAFRYPEKEIVSVPAARVYCEPVQPLKENVAEAALNKPCPEGIDLLDMADVMGKRLIHTNLYRNVMIREEQAMAALEAMSRSELDPKWLIYLPPTMSPLETSMDEELLEHPHEGFAYYRSRGVARVMCQEKHMGSRAVVVMARNSAEAKKRFGVKGDARGVIYSRRGRRFFSNKSMERAVLERLGNALTRAGFWDGFSTKWVCLDCEIMPWSLKALSLIQSQYAAVGCAAGVSLSAAADVLKTALARSNLQGPAPTSKGGSNFDVDLSALHRKIKMRKDAVLKYTEAYRSYCHTVQSINDLKIAPFHVLATEGEVHANKTHEWHMKTIQGLCAVDETLLLPTQCRTVDTGDEIGTKDVCDWWDSMTAGGGEGMVVKPLDFLARGKRGIIQPALKCRGREYLRIIYGPTYTEPENIVRLKRRSLGIKRTFALKEFSLGIEGLERFVQKQPLRLVHECVFGVLALESEPVDPRL